MTSTNRKSSKKSSYSDTWVILDLDDTLVDTSDVYYLAREKFLREMVSSGFSRSQALETFESIETRNIRLFGIFPERYTRSMIESYDILCKKGGIEPSERIQQVIRRIGGTVSRVMPKPLPGAIPLLKWLHDHHFVVLVSRGSDRYQRKKIKAVGLGIYLHKLVIVRQKSASILKQIAASVHRNIRFAWVLGDSIKSDINPGIKAGARCILFEYRHKRYYWRQEYGEEPEGEYFLAKKLADIKKIIECPEKWPKQRSRLYRKHRRAGTRS
jgi:putative hydrolase of the HAD superfamily